MKPETAAACEFAISALDRANALLDQEAQETIALQNPPELVRYYADLREQADAMRESTSAMGKLENALSYKHIPEAFDAAGIQNVKVVGYGLVSLSRRWACSMLDKDKGLEYLRSTGQGGMIIETVPAPTLTAWAKGMVSETGIEPPEDIFKTSITRHCSLTRSK